MNDCTAGHAVMHVVLYMLSASISDFSSSTMYCTEQRPCLETAHVFTMLMQLLVYLHPPLPLRLARLLWLDPEKSGSMTSTVL